MKSEQLTVEVGIDLDVLITQLEALTSLCYDLKERGESDDSLNGWEWFFCGCGWEGPNGEEHAAACADSVGVYGVLYPTQIAVDDWFLADGKVHQRITCPSSYVGTNFERHVWYADVKNSYGGTLVNRHEPSWTISRNCKRLTPREAAEHMAPVGRWIAANSDAVAYEILAHDGTDEAPVKIRRDHNTANVYTCHVGTRWLSAAVLVDPPETEEVRTIEEGEDDTWPWLDPYRALVSDTKVIAVTYENKVKVVKASRVRENANHYRRYAYPLDLAIATKGVHSDRPEDLLT